MHVLGHPCIRIILSLHAGIVWSGVGRINGLELDCHRESYKEFLVTPHHSMTLENTSDTTDLIVFTVFPLLE